MEATCPGSPSKSVAESGLELWSLKYHSSALSIRLYDTQYNLLATVPTAVLLKHNYATLTQLCTVQLNQGEAILFLA